MSQLGVILQESVRTQSEPRTILGLLSEQMDGVDRQPPRRRSFKERLGFIGIGCCGATWGFRFRSPQQQQLPETDPGQDCVAPNMVGSGSGSLSMNLATALAAERQLRRETEELSGNGGRPPWRVSLMRLLEETESREGEEEKGNDTVCCVCMGRNKGAAFIPCGHTFCRVCSRELWLNRGSCPLCNRSIIEILDIF